MLKAVCVFCGGSSSVSVAMHLLYRAKVLRVNDCQNRGTSGIWFTFVPMLTDVGFMKQYWFGGGELEALPVQASLLEKAGVRCIIPP